MIHSCIVPVSGLHLACTLFVALVLGLVSHPQLAALSVEPGTVRGAPVRGSVAMINGGGGNIGVLTGSEGPLLVDAKFTRLALPVLTFENTLRLHLDDETIDLLHLPVTHTDGDTIVHFNTANVIHKGDGCWNGMYPFIDAFNGGSLSGAIAGVDRGLPSRGQRPAPSPGMESWGERLSWRAIAPFWPAPASVCRLGNSKD